MQNIRNLLGLKKSDGTFGIELEYEGERFPLDVEGWRHDRDGSLKGNSIEYILRGPQEKTEMIQSLDNLQQAFLRNKTVINDSFRAGTHVHINCQELTPKEVINFVCTYMMLEEVLINWCSPSRRGNHFCLSTSDSEFLIDIILEVIETGKLNLLNTDDIRYSSINLKSLFAHGSLEFRSLECITNFAKLLTWCNVLENIKKESLKYENPIKIVEAVSGTGYHEWAKSILHPYSDQFLDYTTEAKVRRGLINCQPIAYGRDWNSINLNIFMRKEDCFA